MKAKEVFIGKMFASYMITIIISSIISLIGMLIDGVVIGRILGQESVTAYGLITPIFIVFVALANIYGAAVQTVCSALLGKGEVDKSRKYFTMVTLVIFAVGMISIATMLLFRNEICLFLGANPNEAVVWNDSMNYFIGILPTAILIPLTTAPPALLTFDGKETRMFIGVLLMTVVNIVGDIVSIKVFHSGMLGMGIATSLSYLTLCSIMMVHFFDKNANHHFDFKNIPLREASNIFIIGLPSGLYHFCNTVKQAAFNWILLIVASSAAVAALSVQFTLGNIGAIFTSSISMAVLSVTGIMFGEADDEGLVVTLKKSLKVGITGAFIVGGVIFVAARPLAGAFLRSDAEVMDMAVISVQALAVSLLPQTISIVFMNYFQGIRKNSYAYAVGLLENCILVILIALIASKPLGAMGVWLALPIGRLLILPIIYAMAWRDAGHMPTRIEDFLFMKNKRMVEKDDFYDISLHNMHEVIAASIKIVEFCEEKNIDEKLAFKLALCVEEMAGNVIRHGFADGKKHVMSLRLVYKSDEDSFALRIRDDCKNFDPTKYAETVQNDATKNIGIRLVMDISKNVTYVKTMDFNNLIIELSA